MGGGLCPHIPLGLGLAPVPSPARPCPSALRHAAGRCHPRRGWHGAARRWHGGARRWRVRAGMATLALARPRGERRPGHGLKGFGTGRPEQSRGWSRPGWQPPAADSRQALCPRPEVGPGAPTGTGGTGGGGPGVTPPGWAPHAGGGCSSLGGVCACRARCRGLPALGKVCMVKTGGGGTLGGAHPAVLRREGVQREDQERQPGGSPLAGGRQCQPCLSLPTCSTCPPQPEPPTAPFPGQM